MGKTRSLCLDFWILVLVLMSCRMGCDLGAIWEEQNFSVQLAGNLATVEARGIVLSAQIGDFHPITLVFAWSQTDDVPILLGRMNFFLEFDVCFYRSRSLFELRPKSSMV